MPRGEPPPAPPDGGLVEAAAVVPDTGPFPPPETEAAAATTTGPPAGLPAGLIAYTLDTGIASDVFVRRLDAPEERRVTTSPGADLEPDLSPDGTLVAYQGHLQPKSVESDIYVVGTDGEGRSNLTRAPDLDNRAPAFSPDGQRIAFSSRRGGGTLALWTMAVDGSDVRVLTRSRCEDADWSPDGRLLVCVGDAVGFGGKDLWLVSADDGEMRPLTTTVEPETRPTWSPDGSLIAFQKHVNGSWMVTVVAPDSTGRRAIGPGTNPVWAPDGTLAWAGPFGLSLLPPPFDGPPLVPGDLVGRLGSWVG